MEYSTILEHLIIWKQFSKIVLPVSRYLLLFTPGFFNNISSLLGTFSLRNWGWRKKLKNKAEKVQTSTNYMQIQLKSVNFSRLGQSLSLTLPLRWTTKLDHRVDETVQKTTTRCYKGASVLYNVHWELSAVTQVI